jgi:hypothetical protein
MSIFDPLNELNPLRNAMQNFARQDAASADARFCRMIPHFLDPDECTALQARMAQVSRADSDYPPSYRNNQRIVFEDSVLARQLSDRLRTRLGGDLDFPAAQFLGINPRWRGCRYSVGERFNLHQDGVFQ